MLAFQSEVKFLFDENVDRRLESFLKKEKIDVILKPKGLSNGKLAEYSKIERSILVTNDDDFAEFTRDQIFSIILLKVPQDKIDILIEKFFELIKEKTKAKDFEGNLIILREEGFTLVPLSIHKSID